MNKLEATSSSAPNGPRAAGPLTGVRIVEFAGLGPAPFASMLLADMGADVISLVRGKNEESLAGRVTMRGRRVVLTDLKDAATRDGVLSLLDSADALIEGYRPGVMERLGFAPEVVHARNQKLIYGRMTGWGQDGPLAHAAGHDINYIALTGALAAIGNKDEPVAPLNLVGDYGGGALYLVVGILAALFEASRSGRGQVVDCAMCDGAASLMSVFYELVAAGRWKDTRASNILDGAAHFYGSYECADGKFVAIGAIEPQFYAQLCDMIGLSDPIFSRQMSQQDWPEQKKLMAAMFKTRTRQEWCELMEGTDVCFAPVLNMTEAPHHPHMAARQVFVTHQNVTQPAPAPRFSRTASAIRESSYVDLVAMSKEWSLMAQ